MTTGLEFTLCGQRIHRRATLDTGTACATSCPALPVSLSATRMRKPPPRNQSSNFWQRWFMETGTGGPAAR